MLREIMNETADLTESSALTVYRSLLASFTIEPRVFIVVTLLPPFEGLFGSAVQEPVVAVCWA
jgi:hypothetical protein